MCFSTIDKIYINILYTRIFILYYLYLLELVSNFEIFFLIFYCISFYVFWITSPILIIWLFHNFLCLKIVKIKSKKFCYTIKNWYAKHRFLPWSLANGGSFSMCTTGKEVFRYVKDSSLKVVFSSDKHIAAKDWLLVAIMSLLMGIFVVIEDPSPS